MSNKKHLKEAGFLKRFLPEFKTKRVYFIDENKDSYLELILENDQLNLELKFTKLKNRTPRENELIIPKDFISIKGVNALGNQLSRHSISKISVVESENSIMLHSDKNTVTNSESDDVDSQIKLNF